MRTVPRLAGLSLLLLIPFTASQAAGPATRVQVEFVDPTHYTDIGGYGPEARRNLAALERHLKTEGQRCLAAGDSLALRIVDVDLAGRPEWWHHAGYDLRVMREITWPRIMLHYVLRNGDGSIAGEADARLSDMSYLQRSAYVRNDSAPLPYERAMLRDWFERQFCRNAH